MPRLTIALDIDGTITRHPAFFACLSQAMIAAGHRVIIITYREDRAAAAADLAGWNVAYTSLITATTDALLAAGVDEWKSVICREHGVDVLFEDDARALQHMDDDVLSLLAVDRQRHDLRVVTREGAL